MSTKSKIITAVVSLAVVIAVGIIAVTALISGTASATFKITYHAEQVNCSLNSTLQVFTAKNEEVTAKKQTLDTITFDHQTSNEDKVDTFDNVELENTNDGADYIVITLVIKNTMPSDAQTDVKGIDTLLEVNKSIEEFMKIDVTATVTKSDDSTDSLSIFQGASDDNSKNYYEFRVEGASEPTDYILGLNETLTIQIKLSVKDISKDFDNLEGSYRLTLQGKQII